MEGGGERGYRPGASEEDDRYVLRADLPGVAAADVGQRLVFGHAIAGFLNLVHQFPGGVAALFLGLGGQEFACHVEDAADLDGPRNGIVL